MKKLILLLFVVSFYFGSLTLAENIYAGSGDGDVYRAVASPGETLSQIRNNAGTSFSYTSSAIAIGTNIVLNKFRLLRRGIISFNTNGITIDDDDEVKLNFYISNKSNFTHWPDSAIGLTLIGVEPYATSTLRATDYNTFKSDLLGSITNGSDLSTTNLNSITLNKAGKDYINTEGWTSFGLIFNFDFSGNDNHIDNYYTYINIDSTEYSSGTSTDPFLSIAYNEQQQTYPIISTTTMFLEYITYNATTTITTASTSLTTAQYVIPFFLYFLVLSALCFTILFSWFFYYMIYLNK